MTRFPFLTLVLCIGLMAEEISQADTPRFSTVPLPTELTRAMREDATLLDVHFTDARNGWAVGDRGAIWHTRDGGHRWETQESGVACRLSCVEFADMNIGWAAGGWTDPISHVSRSVLLTTNDGGKTWNSTPTQLLGEFLTLGMSDTRRGWAITRPSAVFPSGILRTDNGGRGWSPVETTLTTSWQTGDLSNPELGILVGKQAHLAFTRLSGIKPSRTNLGGLQNVRAMRLLKGQNGILVGDSGLVMQTPDGGGSWHPVAALSPAASTMFDWRTIATHESHIWIAGQPGTYVLHSPDGGKSWQWHETGHALPIRALHFTDKRHGWAVGALGNILATRDGGRTWQARRGEATRLAWLGIFADAEAVPLELVARLSSGEGYYGGMISVARRDFDPPNTTNDLARRAREAARTVGAGENEQLWQFPIRQKGLRLSAESITDGWNQLHEEGGLEELQEQLVRRIRTWRPTVIVTQSPSNDTDAAASLLRHALLRAVQAAADDKQYPNQINDLKLVAWKVPKVYSVSTTSRTGRSGLNTAQFMPRLGKSLHGFAAAARGLLDSQQQTPPVAYRYESLIDDSLSGSLRDDLFVGRHLPLGSEARRAATAAPAIPLVSLRRLADRRRALPALLAQAQQDRHAGTAWRNKILKTLHDLDRPVAAEILFQLATEYSRGGHSHLAAESYAMLSELYTEHALASAAKMRLVQHYASSEDQAGARQSNRNSRLPTNSLSRPNSASGLRTAGGPIATQQRVRQAGLFEPNLSDNAQTAIRWAGELKGFDEALFADPRIQLPLAAAYRQAGQQRDAQRLFLALSRSRPHDAWQAVATRELSLIASESKESGATPPAAATPTETAPPGTTAKASAWRCVRTDKKPVLDGKLDEACWQDTDKTASPRAIPLRSAYGEDGAWPAVARLAYDDEYLYLAVRCGKAPGVSYAKTDMPRQRDKSLAMRDRVTLLLDVDRDYTTYYRLTIDSRGWIAEQVGDNATWNPEWFVANVEDETSWSCEAAIRWSDLTESVPTANTVWAAGLQRTVPGVGFQSASQPAAVRVFPEGFLHLRFE